MSRVTYFVVLPFRYVEGEMVAGEPQECRDAFKARSVAAVLASNADNCKRRFRLMEMMGSATS